MNKKKFIISRNISLVSFLLAVKLELFISLKQEMSARRLLKICFGGDIIGAGNVIGGELC